MKNSTNSALIDALIEIGVRLVILAVTTLVIMGVVALFGHHIAWWAAGLFALGGMVGVIVIDDDNNDWFS